MMDILKFIKILQNTTAFDALYKDEASAAFHLIRDECPDSNYGGCAEKYDNLNFAEKEKCYPPWVAPWQAAGASSKLKAPPLCSRPCPRIDKEAGE
ncbi:MAG: hypothetical protein GY847_14405 [Proteobacteria bacterium]|nr:hypothetical protein [Pseudomonadota bacterium]